MTQLQSVTFKNHSWDVSATLRLPDGFDASKRYTAIVFGSYRDGYALFNRVCSTDKTLQVVQGACHYDLHDQPEATGKALEHITPFFNKHLEV